MITRRPSADRGHSNLGWLDTYHTFSFADYFDPAHMHFASLRVINEDTVAPGQGFDTHAHDNMEIVTCVLSGALEHRDSMGNGSVLRPGELQRMSAGTGITHSEFNPSSNEPVHLLQIWIVPGERGIAPSWEQKAFDPAERQGKMQLVASRTARDGSLQIHQDACIYLVTVREGDRIIHALDGSGPHDVLPTTDQQTRRAWVQVTKGTLKLNGIVLAQGDGAAVSDEAKLEFVAGDGEKSADCIVFDLA